RQPWLPWAIICGGLPVFIVLALALLAIIQLCSLTDQLGLPVLSIAGIVSLMAAVALVAVSFAAVNLADGSQALGLPSGSVSAIIAVSLIALFAILTVYLFSSLRKDGYVSQDVNGLSVIDQWNKRENGQIVGHQQ